jgi:uncharacterized Zn finger protein
MLTPFSSEDLGRLFDSRALTRGRSLVLLGAVRISLEGSSILGTVEALDATHEVRLTPALAGNRVTFETACTCHVPACTHLAAAAWAALDRFPALRKADPAGLFETLAGPRPASTV